MVCGFPRSARKTAHRRSEVPYGDVDLLPDDQIALFQAIDDLNLDRSLDPDCDRRGAGAVPLTDFDEMAAFKRPDRRGWQPQHILFALQHHVDLHNRAWRESLAF